MPTLSIEYLRKSPQLGKVSMDVSESIIVCS